MVQGSGYNVNLRQPTYYELLGVPPGAEGRCLHAAFIACTTVWHPDKGVDQADINRRNNVFASITAAYAVLKVPSTRKQYDATLALQGGQCTQCKGAGLKQVQVSVHKRATVTCSACNSTGQADGGLPAAAVYKG